MGRPAVDPITRFEAKIEVDAVTGCWQWVAGTYSNRGFLYGQFFDGKYNVRAHRFAWAYYNGPIPIDRQLYRRCATLLCVRPAHHELDVINRHCASVSHCPQGHPYSGDNLGYNSVSRGRVCRTCTAVGNRRYDARPIARALRRFGRVERRLRALAG